MDFLRRFHMSDIERDDIFRKFGPRLFEALVRLMLAEINELRSRAGLTEKTEKDFLNGLDEKNQNVTKYKWMKSRADILADAATVPSEPVG
jgi:hypothetical protein